MIDDVITGGPKLLRSPIIKHIVPKTTAIPDKFQGVKPDDAQLKKLRSNVSYVAYQGYIKLTLENPALRVLLSILSSTILSFFKRKNTTNGKTVDTESSSIQRDHEESGEDFPDSDEEVAIPNTNHQEPEGERSGFPVERLEDPDPTNLVAKGHPIDTSLSGHPADNGVEETNVSSEIFDGDSGGETHHTGEEDEENGTAGVRNDCNFHDICEAVSDLPLRTDLQHH
ncbi:Uncharacterized protein APZ42_027955 [Daphnia magna]|uniref:Uncharacterized protein n=1 Tax=Daphnia magna TaxID=35525 RepID=A0A164QXI7_9CRUS|nr:Uncharacterized protein APZ42_027955 [Daphnia magna]